MAKIKERWEYGIFVGVRRKSGEVWIAAGDKVFGVRSVRRIPVQDRWGDDCIKWIRRVPWNRYKDALDADGALPEGAIVVEAREASVRPEGVGYHSRDPRKGAEGVLHQEGGCREARLHPGMWGMQ